jgi:hypothetical protein
LQSLGGNFLQTLLWLKRQYSDHIVLEAHYQEFASLSILFNLANINTSDLFLEELSVTLIEEPSFAVQLEVDYLSSLYIDDHLSRIGTSLNDLALV